MCGACACACVCVYKKHMDTSLCSFALYLPMQGDKIFNN